MMGEQLRKGIIDEVSESPDPPGRVHYLPHHSMVKKGKAMSKVRVVYDTSCITEVTGLSLNQCLQVGLSFGPSILDMLIRFRTHRVALVGGVEKAFLMVSVADKDRDTFTVPVV